jgi:hypothetical protein
MVTVPVSLQLIDHDCKPVDTRAYTVPRSMEQQLQPIKEIVRLMDIGVLEEEYSSEWASLFPSFAIPKKDIIKRVATDFRRLNILFKHNKSTVSYSKDWGMNMIR